MKANKSKLRILPILLALLLMLASMPTSALAATKNFSAVVVVKSMKVYRDAGLKKYWGKVPKNTVVTVKSYTGDVAKISYNGKTGYAEVDDMDAVETIAKKAVTGKKTRVYKTASTKSKSVAVKKGTAVYVLAVNGNVAKIERNGVVGYTRADHLIIEGQSGSVSTPSAQDRFEQAFKEQQEALKEKEENKKEETKPEESKKEENKKEESSKEETAIEKVFNSGKYTNEELCYAFLVKEAGYNHAAACGIIANIKYESGFKPGSIGDNGKSLGICQWYASRRTLLIDWCGDNGYDPESLLGQLYFLKYELEERYPKVHKYLLAIENTPEGAYDAGYYFCYNYERPAKKETSSVTRGNYAKDKVYNKFQNL